MVSHEPTWDLSQLVDETDVPIIMKRLHSMVAEANNLRQKYHATIEHIDSESILELLQAKDEHYLKYENVSLYCHLKYQADSTNLTAKQLNSALRQAQTDVDKALTFIDIELGKLIASRPMLISEPKLAQYKHYLERRLRKLPHLLSETEERVITAKDKNGIKAWRTLQSELLSTKTFVLEISGKTRSMPYVEIGKYFQAPDRDLRQRSHQAVYEVLGKEEILFASALRSICDDYLLMCEWRKYPNVVSPSLIDNDIDQKTIDSLMHVIQHNLALYHRYLKIKAELMDLSKLANYDILAPLPKVPEKKYSWEEAHAEIARAYGRFDKQIGKWIEEMYDQRHIDGQARKGKRAGAFSSTWISGKSAYVSQNFNGTIVDLYTLAHELGHSIQDYLGTRAQKPSNLEIGNCTAETGSRFGELLLTNELLLGSESKREEQTILAAILDEFGIGVFRIAARFLFEQSLYDSIRKGRFLDGDTVSKLWVEARDRIFGDSIDWLGIMKWEWTVQLHYYKADFRFYNYPYAFGQLFVFALYQLYQEQRATFIPKLKRFLAAGSSESPRALANEMGCDITDQAFWQRGIDQAEKLLQFLEKTI